MRFLHLSLAVTLAVGVAACSGSPGGSAGMPPTEPSAMSNTGTAGIAASNVTPDATTINITVHGDIVKIVSGGFVIRTTTTCPGNGQLDIVTSSSTAFSGLSPAVGYQADIGGVGSCTTSVKAVNVDVVKANTASTTTMTHVLTEDYLGSPDGTSAVSWSTAAKYLTWAETGIQDATAIHNAGIKTMAYVDPNRTTVGTGDPFLTSNETTFAHNCSSSRITSNYASSVTEYVMDPAASSLRSLYGNFVSSLRSEAHFDAIFEDDAAPLSEDIYTPFSSMPCGYSTPSWISEEIGLAEASSIPVLLNALDALDGHSPSQSIQMLAASNAMGGNYEECYASPTIVKESGWVWEAVENSELEVNARNKAFACMVANQSSASSQTDARLFAYASFLLTYNPSTSIYRVEYTTGSGLHVMPETQLVALSPTQAEPANISSLLVSGGTYTRQYGACYLRGSLVGPCAVVVNPNATSSARFPFTTYHHTLTISGSGVADGGTVSADGPAPAGSLPPLEARIVFP
jgi:hypothetical protein